MPSLPPETPPLNKTVSNNCSALLEKLDDSIEIMEEAAVEQIAGLEEQISQPEHNEMDNISDNQTFENTTIDTQNEDFNLPAPPVPETDGNITSKDG